MERPAKPWGFVAIWQFRPKPGAEKAFADAYGPKGVWASFFAAREGFVETELTHDVKNPGCYLTLDFWESKAAYETFREANAAEYGQIDATCEALTAEEKLIGYFERIG